MKNKVISIEYVEKNYISIKELKKVLDIEEYDNVDVLSLISTLMSEVDRLEDIEDRKVQIEYQLVFDKGVKSVEDKIRKEIEEIKNCRLSTCNEQINKSLKERYEIEDEICEYFEELLQSGQESDQEGGQENE